MPCRVISYHPGPGEKLDPRAAIAGRHRPGGGGGDWESGLFDRGSWVESQAGWARTVVSVMMGESWAGWAQPPCNWHCDWIVVVLCTLP
jgi:hypothetical protein